MSFIPGIALILIGAFVVVGVKFHGAQMSRTLAIIFFAFYGFAVLCLTFSALNLFLGMRMQDEEFLGGWGGFLSIMSAISLALAFIPSAIAGAMLLAEGFPVPRGKIIGQGFAFSLLVLAVAYACSHSASLNWW